MIYYFQYNQHHKVTSYSLSSTGAPQEMALDISPEQLDQLTQHWRCFIRDNALTCIKPENIIIREKKRQLHDFKNKLSSGTATQTDINAILLLLLD